MIALMQPRVPTAVILAIGTAVRTYSYLANPSLFLDESMLALNLLDRDFHGLCEPLDYEQTAPVLFLLMSKVSTLLFGPAELALRAIPLASGIAALLLLPTLCRAAKLSALETSIATLAFALTPMCIEYASIFKQFSGDVLATVLMSLATVKALQDLSDSRRLLTLGALGSILIWISHASLFTIAASGLLIAFASLRLRQPKFVCIVAVIGLVWTASFAVNYHFFTSKAEAKPGFIAYMFEYWDTRHNAFAPRNFQFPFWLFKKAIELPQYLGWSFPLIAVGVSVVGLISLSVRQSTRTVSLLFVLATALAISASALGKYPFADRLTLWLAVPLSLFFAAGVSAFVSIDHRVWKFLGTLILASVCFQPMKLAAARFIWPERFIREDLRTVLRAVNDRSDAGESMIAIGYTARAAAYYHEINVPAGLSDRKLLIRSAQNFRDGLQRQVLPGEKFWILFSHVPDAETTAVKKSVGEVATAIDEVVEVCAIGTRWVMR